MTKKSVVFAISNIVGKFHFHFVKIIQKSNLHDVVSHVYPRKKNLFIKLSEEMNKTMI